MTMLDQMRRHMGWLKWSLGLVVLAFVIFYIPDFLRSGGADAASSDKVASVIVRLHNRRRPFIRFDRQAICIDNFHRLPADQFAQLVNRRAIRPFAENEESDRRMNFLHERAFFWFFIKF